MSGHSGNIPVDWRWVHNLMVDLLENARFKFSPYGFRVGWLLSGVELQARVDTDTLIPWSKFELEVYYAGARINHSQIPIKTIAVLEAKTGRKIGQVNAADPSWFFCLSRKRLLVDGWYRLRVVK